MKTYCVKCKKKSPTNNLKIHQNGNRYSVRGTCKCGCKKHQFISKDTKDKLIKQHGSGIIEKIRKANIKSLRKMPRPLRKLLEKHGMDTIEKIIVCRKPLSRVMKTLLNIVTLGQFNKAIKKLNYDDVYHLRMNVYLNNGSIYGLEKNQRITVKKGGFPNTKDVECMTVDLEGKNLTLKALIKNGEKKGGKGFYRYSGHRNNCQKWINDIMSANRINSPELKKFILQDVRTLFGEYIKSLNIHITDIAGALDRLFYG
jgi:hypothetical protein